MPNTLEILEAQLDDLNPGVRAAALRSLLDAVAAGRVELSAQGREFNLHCHSFFSFNGYGYSPSGLVWRGRRRGLMAMGLVDFDVLDGVGEFLEACALLGMRGGAGFETRVFVPEFSDRVINSPGEPGISYHMGMGFVPGPVRDSHLVEELKALAQARNRKMVGRINGLLAEIALDYDADVLPLTPAGNATERHVCTAYHAKSERVFPDTQARADWWAVKLGMEPEAVLKAQADAPGFQGIIRAKTMKAGGVGYVEAKGDEFPEMGRVNSFTLANGAIPVFAFLDGTTSGEQCMDELLDVMTAGGVAAVNIIPDRNWNFKDPETRRKKAANLHDFAAKARARELPIIVGTEMNAHGQRFVDDFDAPEMAPLYPDFARGAFLLHGHTLLQAHAGMGYMSEWAADGFSSTADKNRFFEEAGRLAADASALAEVTVESTPAEVIARLAR